MPRTVAISLAVLFAIIGTRQTAEACACCGSETTRTPIGWTTAGGAVMIDMTSNAACSKTHKLEVWTIGATDPAGCYDLLDDPEKRGDCGIGADDFSAKERPSSQVKRFGTTATALPASSVRVTKQRVAASEDLRVAVDVLTIRGWQRLWSSTVRSGEAFTGGAGQTHPAPLELTVWPNPRGDRAMMLIENEDGGGGSTTMVRWVKLPPDSMR